MENLVKLFADEKKSIERWMITWDRWHRRIWYHWAEKQRSTGPEWWSVEWRSESFSCSRSNWHPKSKRSASWLRKTNVVVIVYLRKMGKKVSPSMGREFIFIRDNLVRPTGGLTKSQLVLINSWFARWYSSEKLSLSIINNPRTQRMEIFHFFFTPKRNIFIRPWSKLNCARELQDKLVIPRESRGLIALYPETRVNIENSISGAAILECSLFEKG